MAVKYCDAFTFPKEFGFSGSAKGDVNARDHSQPDMDGTATYVGRKRGGTVKRHFDTGGSTGNAIVDPNATANATTQTQAQMQNAQANQAQMAQNQAAAAAIRQQQAEQIMAAGRPPGMAHGGKVRRKAMGGGTMVPDGSPQGALGQTGTGLPSGRPVAASSSAGNPMAHATITMPLSDAALAARGAVDMGRDVGIKQAAGAVMAGAQKARQQQMLPPGAAMATAATPVPSRMPAQATQGIPQMRKGGAHWIQDTSMKKGALHEQLGVPKGQKIPQKRLEQAARSDDPTLARRARFAETLKGLSHGKKK